MVAKSNLEKNEPNQANNSVVQSKTIHSKISLKDIVKITTLIAGIVLLYIFFKTVLIDYINSLNLPKPFNKYLPIASDILLFVILATLSFIIKKKTVSKYYEVISLVGVAFSIPTIVEYIIAIPMATILGESITLPVWNAIYQALIYAFSLVAILLICNKYIKDWQITREEIGLKGLPTFTDIGLGIVGILFSLFAAGIILNLMNNIFPWFNPEQVQDVGFNSLGNGFDRIVAFLALVVIAPIFEEIIFRGFLYGKLRAKFSLIFSLIVTSALFGFMHGQWNVGITVGIMSAVMCLQREITGTIYSGIITHMLKNGIAFFIIYII